MSGMYGADIAQLRALAQQFDGAADRLDQDRMSVGNAIQVKAWFGPVAVQFRHEWESVHSRKVLSASTRLRDAARSLRANADEQDRASAADGGSGSRASGDGEIGNARLSPETEADYEQIFEAIKLMDTANSSAEDIADLISAVGKGSLDYKSFADWLGDVKGMDAGTLLSLGGMAISAKELGEAIGTEDPAAQLEASLELLMGAVGVKVPLAGIAWNIGSFLGETGYNSLQSFYDSPSSALDAGARSIYGADATFDGLSPEQKEIILARYEGWEGLIASNWDHVAGAGHDFWQFITGGGGRGPR